MSNHTTTVSISGMTCEHCVNSVTEELSSITGVENVDVELNVGGISTATINSSLEVSDAEIGEAVAEAGYLIVANQA